MMYEDVVRDFALRTKKNLQIIERLRRDGSEPYEVTQLVNSMLGLLVFPQQEYIDSIPRTPLAELASAGWPIPTVRGSFAQPDDLNQLIRYLRNAIAHFNIKFVGDGQNNIAGIRVWNMAPVKDKNGRMQRDSEGRIIARKNWEAELGVAELRGIAERFIDLLLSRRT